MLARLDIRQIRYFVALYEERSITRAAARLHVVQPAVSMQLRKLEANYGVTLFDRTSHGMVPSAVANELYGRFQHILGDVDAVHNLLLGANTKIFGDVAIGLPPSLAMGPVAGVVSRYCEAFPEVTLRLAEGYSANVVEWLENGEIDLGILSTDFGERLQTFPIAEDELVAVVPRETGQRLGESATLAQIAALDLILPSPRNLVRILLETHFVAADVPLVPKLTIDSLATVVHLVRSGRWSTILPRICAPELETTGNLALVPFDPPIHRRLVAAHSPRRAPSPAAEAFIRMLAEDMGLPDPLHAD